VATPITALHQIQAIISELSEKNKYIFMETCSSTLCIFTW